MWLVRSYGIFFVESISDHQGCLTRSTIEFFVKWIDYPEFKNTWEPYTNLRDNEVLHDYLKLKGLHPVDVARRDRMEFFVESIADHQGGLTRSTIEFFVKWKDYRESENTWEPYTNLRDNEVLHDYLKLKGLHRLINKQHR